MSRSLRIFIDGTDPLGGVSTWAMRVIANCHFCQPSLVGVWSDPEPQSYAGSFTSGYDILSVPGLEDLVDVDVARIEQWEALSPAIKELVDDNTIIIPNYFEAIYRLAGLAALAGRDVCCIGFCHTDEAHYYRLLSQYEAIIHGFIAVSQQCYSTLCSILPLHRRKDIFYLPYGIPTPVERPRTVLSIPLKLLYAGRIVQKQKRIFDLVSLVQHLETLAVPFILTIAGGGEDLPQLQSKLQTFADKITFAGIIPPAEMPRLYKEHGILVSTSETEGLSLTMLEAMAHGMIPVVTGVSGATQLIIQGINGFLYSVENTEEAAILIRAIFLDPDRALMISASAQKSVAHDYSEAMHFAKFEQIVVKCAPPRPDAVS